MLFEQCSENVIVENSATHGGDGIFAFAGREALGEAPAPDADFDYTGRGHRNNLFARNDLSYAAAHGLELTFSFGNRIFENRLVGNAICGIWGGYSRDTRIAANEFASNGEAGYGLERGGINIEHGQRNLIEWNYFRENACGVHLWWDPDEGLAALPWSEANGHAATHNTIAANRFEGDALGIQLRATENTLIGGNEFVRVPREVEAEPGAEPREPSALPSAFAMPEYPVFGDSRPVGARSELRGREQIVVDEWGPRDLDPTSEPSDER